MELWLAAAIGAAILVTAVLGAARARAKGRGRPERDERRLALPGERSCPVCSSLLGPGERVSSKLFPGKGDRIMHIFGCARCWPATPSAPRLCPVCGKELDREGYLIARCFYRPAAGQGQARMHVHVLGCPGCRAQK